MFLFEPCVIRVIWLGVSSRVFYRTSSPSGPLPKNRFLKDVFSPHLRAGGDDSGLGSVGSVGAASISRFRFSRRQTRVRYISRAGSVDHSRAGSVDYSRAGTLNDYASEGPYKSLRRRFSKNGATHHNARVGTPSRRFSPDLVDRRS